MNKHVFILFSSSGGSRERILHISFFLLMVGKIISCDEIIFKLILLDKTIKLWKVSERDKRAEGYNLKEDSGLLRDPSSIRALRVPVLRPMELMVEASKCSKH